MHSNAADVATYLEEAPADRRECLNAIRNICREVLVGYDEDMDYGMPSYRRDGGVEVAFASQKNYISLYILQQDVLEAHRDRMTGLNIGKGCIRYPSPKKVDLGLIRSMLEVTAASSSKVR